MSETAKAWAFAVICALLAMGVIFIALPQYLDHWDKARARTRVEVKNIEAVGDYLRAQRIQAAAIGGNEVLRR